MTNHHDSGLCMRSGDEELRRWFLEHKPDTPEYRDPHNCYGSCAEPGPGCLACSNTSYLRCTRSSVPICLHPRLRCNHQADCDNAEDERLEECYHAYLREGHINKYATLRCQDKVHPKMQGRPYTIYHTF